MGIFVTSKSQARHGAYAIETPAPRQFIPQGTGVAAIVAQFEWGPPNQLVEPSSIKNRWDIFAPPGFDFASAARLACIQKAWPTLKCVRASASTAAKSVCTLTSGATAIVELEAKYPGAAGNNLVATVSDASDGVATHFNVTVLVTGPSGRTTDTFVNVDATGTTITVENLAQALLVGAVSRESAGRPTNGNYTFTGGTSPSVVAADYVGVAGTGDRGLSILEGDPAIRHIITDDCGSALRSAVNLGVQAHVNLMGDRVGYINGNSGQIASAAISDKAQYTSDRVVYCDPWVYILDDILGNRRLVPSAPFAASVACQLPTSTSIAWKATTVQEMLSGIVGLEYHRGDATGTNTTNGIATFIREATGGFTIEADVSCAYPTDRANGYLTRRRFVDLIAVTFVSQARPWIDAPNLPVYRQEIVDALDGMMSTFKRNADQPTAVYLDHCLDYRIDSLAAYNSQAELDAGMLTIPLLVKTSSGIRLLFLNIKAGEGVSITE